MQGYEVRPPYLGSNPLAPVIGLNIQVLHVDLLPLPGGVGEVVEGEPNKLFK